MNPGSLKRLFGLILASSLIFFSFTAPFRCLANFPRQLDMFSGQDAKLNLDMPVMGRITVSDPSIVQINGSNRYSSQFNLKEPIRLKSAHAGQTEMRVNLLGKIPFKTVKINVIPDLKVIPGGQTIGVKLKSEGIMIVGHHMVNVPGNKKVSPGEMAGIRVGDTILSINGVSVNDVSKVSGFVNTAGKTKQPLRLIVKRRGETMKVNLNPVYDEMEKNYRLGLYIRDSAAGVGTLTFYAPEQKRYGALGHVISDLDTQMPIAVGSGEIVHSIVTSISKSQNGDPGEKIANFFRESRKLGNIEKNTAFGIFGRMASVPDFGVENRAIPVALAHEVKEGPAQIYTVVNGQKVEKFDIRITKVARQDYPATKGLVIKITDPRLLEQTGGIVQGMSGSPIIQNGKIIGAVTHVFVNDPTSGYGCFIEWMLRDAGLMSRSTLSQQAG
ncbi:SpoIVB peptidase [Gorillibacterium massiliense]|uniref:SpoIVB peptidase n=1 Tax=Gorillibacterium massiliense TaxID=1280390 RepID=UPI001EE2028F|nr:SpoIVB peptidase [Gorillibacterium massiliense]